MSRGLSAGMLSQVAASNVNPILLFYGEFASGTVRMWSGLGDLSFDSQTWLGAGSLVQVSNVEETSEIKASGVL